ncbi:MAG: lysozyme [Desulfovibrio sp.]|jgi:lysozyme|nr:lysozyme [Desulfovibrio sp.]
MMTRQKKGRGAEGVGIAALVGAGAAALLRIMIPRYEGEILRGYADPVGIATKCYGDTENVETGRIYSREECLRSLEKRLADHAGPVMACAPELAGYTDGEKAAAVSLAYNIGVDAFCRSTAARKFRAGDRAGACAAFGMWNRAGGRVLPGLVRRRADERRICESGLDAAAGHADNVNQGD